MITAEIIKDSISPRGHRLTTWILNYPRFIHAELLTHRVFSKNSASSRAIPIEKVISMVQEAPAIPVYWGSKQKGMSAGEELDNTEYLDFSNTLPNVYNLETQKYRNITKRDYANFLWREARDCMIEYAKEFDKIGLHKQITNRILEPWFMIRIILTTTETGNYFALRAHKDAQPELQLTAYKMLDGYNESKPTLLQPGEWHIPFSDKIDQDKLVEVCLARGLEKTEDNLKELSIKIAIARCARVSYYNFQGKDDYTSDLAIFDKLLSGVPKHCSPAEHVAMCMDTDDFIGNFRGWKQYRKFFEDENLSDPRVKK